MSAAQGGDEMVALPAAGRIFDERRRVRLGDASPGGRLRLDALAGFAQDVASDDSNDAGLAAADSWVVRRTAVEVHQFPVYDEVLALRTWCSGVGSRWADRRTQALGDRGGHVEMATVWVAVDLATGRPRALGADFAARYAASAAGRAVSARLRHAPPSPATPRRPWPLRFSDFDVLGHVNNAAYWVVVEELLAERRALRAPLRVELEYHQSIEQAAAVDLAVEHGDRGAALWLLAAGTSTVHSSAVLGMIT